MITHHGWSKNVWQGCAHTVGRPQRVTHWNYAWPRTYSTKTQLDDSPMLRSVWCTSPWDRTYLRSGWHLKPRIEPSVGYSPKTEIPEPVGTQTPAVNPFGTSKGHDTAEFPLALAAGKQPIPSISCPWQDAPKELRCWLGADCDLPTVHSQTNHGFFWALNGCNMPCINQVLKATTYILEMKLAGS